MARDYLGVGTVHPASINTYGQLGLVDDIDLVKQSLVRILSTPVGTDFMNRAFGSELSLLPFQPNDAVQQSLIEYLISDAVDKWEKRVRYVRTDFAAPSPDHLDAEVFFVLLASNQIDSFIYPFYRETRY